MLDYFVEKEENKCCGCRACENICPVNAISFEPNQEGFLYPKIDCTRCVNCFKCEKICPIMNRPFGNTVEEVYAIQIKDEYELKNSSSGGVFRLLANKVIEKKGYVVGCVWSENLQPILSIATSTDELELMQGSKYLSSNPRNIYKKVKKLLEKNELVLFTGTPCQCVALLNFLHKKYDNLITADFLCHGVPSQKAFDAYIKNLMVNNRIDNWKDRKIEYKFRDKEKMGWGIVSSLSWDKKGKKYKKFFVGRIDSYDYAYTQGFLNRYSCYDCQFRGENRFTDFTFCDFWGYNDFYSELNQTKGVSALSVNSNKGRNFFEDCKEKALVFKADAKYVAVENPSLIKEDKENIPYIRHKIYSDIDKLGWKKVSRRNFRCKNWFLRNIWYMIPNSLKKIIR